MLHGIMFVLGVIGNMQLFGGPIELMCSECECIRGIRIGFSVICINCLNDGWKRIPEGHFDREDLI